jgi:alkanesulfonate monooxygenase SsuD/methylene tetrahydromethanopterin reductase-like flavin-dependent oxidoreductase (luciferase family)
MKLGFGLITCQHHPGDPRSDEELYADGLDLAVYAEELGFDSVWTSEHHFVDDGYMPSLLPMSAAIAARTQRVEIGTGLLLIPLHHPIRIAEDAATVDLISGGRLILGLGLGWREEEFEGFDVPLGERARRLEHAVSVLRDAWHGEAVSNTGASVHVTPRPTREVGPPIWIGAWAEAAVRRAGRIADGFIAGGETPEELARHVGWALAERGDEPFTVALHMPTFAWNGRADEAWELVSPSLRYASWKYDDMEHARRRSGPPPAPPQMTASEEQALREEIVLGTPQQVADRLRAFQDTIGTELHFIADLYGPGMDPSLQREVMCVFAEEVAPLLQ